MAMTGVPVDDGNINNLRDILQTYNRITGICFDRCVSNLNYHNLTNTESDCVASCAGKLITSNQKIMGTFMELQVRKQRQMAEDLANQQQPTAVSQSPLAAAVGATAALPAPPSDNAASVEDSTRTATDSGTDSTGSKSAS